MTQTLFSTRTEAELVHIPLSELYPHPQNPRVAFDEGVVSQVAAEITRQGFFSEEHAILCRPHDGGFQIVSGHHRWKAAQKAGLDEIPAWVRPMDDGEAYMLLVTENSQSELSKLEIGLHALEVAGRGKRGRGNKGDGLKAYAERTGYGFRSVSQWAAAAEVYKSSTRVELLDVSVRALHEISKAPETLWEPLVDALIKNEWSVRDTRHYRQKVEEFEIPDRWADVFLDRQEVARAYLATGEFSPQTVARLIDLAENTVQRIETYDVETEEFITEFETWLSTYRGTPGDGSWDPRALIKYQRKLQVDLQSAEEEARKSWALGNWRDHVHTLEDGSVRLVLTDPPYGIDYQSDYRLDRRKDRKHEIIENDREDAAGELSDALRHLYPKLADDAHVLVFTHWRTEHEAREAIESAGYDVRGSLIWVKNNTGMGDPNTTFAPKHERIIHAVKGSPTLFHREPDVLHADRVPTERHPTEKPTELLERLIRCTTAKGELVVDPFGGVASTLVAARESERAAWGCEVNEKYHATGAGRLSR